MTPLARTIAVGRRRRLAAVLIEAGHLASDVRYFDAPASCMPSSRSAVRFPAQGEMSAPAPGRGRGGGAPTNDECLAAEAATGMRGRTPRRPAQGPPQLRAPVATPSAQAD